VLVLLPAAVELMFVFKQDGLPASSGRGPTLDHSTLEAHVGESAGGTTFFVAELEARVE
jgi:hypothetical protein